MSPFLKRRCCLGRGGLQRDAQALPRDRTIRIPRPPPPADALTMTGKPISRARTRASSSFFKGSGLPGRIGTPGFLHRTSGLNLIAHNANHVGAWADELDIASFADFGEVGRLGQKAIAGMNGINVRDLGGADDGRDIQIALSGGAPADADGFVRKAHVERVAVRRLNARQPSRCPSPYTSR